MTMLPETGSSVSPPERSSFLHRQGAKRNPELSPHTDIPDTEVTITMQNIYKQGGKVNIWYI